ncbi:Salicylaldehyde dehydrogenase [Cladobotryum mycophilum]|uniref:Salicylaldehyde dehydrogenase n=1 Tax=Cladobotryum mycophilum TaxID=491253 RepID=A0ABR0SNU8_9HYPO
MSAVEVSGKQVVPLWVNGAALPVNSDSLFEVIHGEDGSIAHYAHGANVEEAKAAVEAAAAAFPSWSRTPYTQRREILLKVADILNTRADELGEMQAVETSANPRFGKLFARMAGPHVHEIAGNIANALTGAVPPIASEGYGFVLKEPVGPVLIIVPWNGPSVLGPRGIASALAAGCTVVLKASEICPRNFLMLTQIFEEAGLPKGCLNQIQASRENGPEVTEAIISHPAIRKIDFIGSAPVGRIIGQLAAKYLKPVLMELGGKGPFIVLKDANLQKAAQLAAYGAFIHHGQICMSTERIIVVKEVAEEFSKLLKEEVINNWSTAGSAASKSFADKSHQLLASAKQNGAEFLVGDNSFSVSSKTGLTPTIVTGVKPEDGLYDTETFGPSASLYVVGDAEEALAFANQSTSGLAGAIWTEDIVQGLDYSKTLECGLVHINSSTLTDNPSLPVTGTKASGWGSSSGKYGINEFLVEKTVTVRSTKGAYFLGN